MRIVGLITEYNPFHNGHQYHIEEAKRVANADYVVAVMSGNFVQRGAPAFLPKHLRAKAALLGGCDLVLELPVRFASGSAEYFAMGAVSLLHNLGCVDAICFGSECGNLTALQSVAELLSKEPESFRASLTKQLKSGCSFPAAREQAVRDVLGEAYASLLSSPNNILGIEYLKALYYLNSKMTPYTISRKDSAYHDKELRLTLSSASAIRRTLIRTETLAPLQGHVPKEMYAIMEETYRKRFPLYADDFSLLFKHCLLSETKDSLADYVDVTPELASRIWNRRDDFVTFDGFCELLKTKELTYARISRALLHILLRLKKESAGTARDISCGYARILGFRLASATLLSHLKKQAVIPLVSKLSDVSLSPDSEALLSEDIFAANLYESVVTEKYKTPFQNEYRHPIVRI